MIYEFDLAIPRNTAVASPATLTAAMVFGTIERVEFQFPAGCAGLVGIQVYDRAHQVWPSNPDVWFVSDDYVIAFNESYDLMSLPFQLELRGYNLDDTYTHTIAFRFGVTTPSRGLAAQIGALFRRSPPAIVPTEVEGGL